MQSLTELRQRLALDVEDGKAGAVKQLEEIEQSIAQLVRNDERAALAVKERAARAAAAQAARETAERRALEEQHRLNHDTYKNATRRLGDAVRAARGHGDARAGLVTAVETGRALEPIRAAIAELLDASRVAAGSCTRLYGAIRPPYKWTTIKRCAVEGQRVGPAIGQRRREKF